MSKFIPKPTAAFLDRFGSVTREWRDYLAGLESSKDSAAATQAILQQIAEIKAQIGTGSYLPTTTTVTGQQSVQSVGQLATGGVVLTLINDEAAPGPSRYYGTNDAGAKGFHELPPGGVPYFIPAGTTFRVPEYLQSLFAMAIDCEGYLDVEGYLIEVD